MNSERAGEALRRLTTSTYILSVREADARPFASTVSWVVPLSFEPPLLGVALQSDSRTLALVRAARAFTISILSRDARSEVIKLGRASSEVADKTLGVSFGECAGGLPIPARASAWLECHVRAEQSTGDHIFVVAEVSRGGGVEDAGRPEWSYWGG